MQHQDPAVLVGIQGSSRGQAMLRPRIPSIDLLLALLPRPLLHSVSKTLRETHILARAASSRLGLRNMALLDAVSLSAAQVALVSLGLSGAYLLGLAVYRLYLGPLAEFPGPRLAALTLWYEFYYDVVKQGRYSWKIIEMHEKYGRTRVSCFVGSPI